MPLPANTPDFASGAPKAAPKVTATAGKAGAPDPRKVAVQELANAQKALLDAEDALKAASDLVTAKTKAWDAIRKAK